MIEYDNQLIKIANNVQGIQGMEQTFLHELIHAMARDRDIEWENADEEFITEQLAKALYQVLKDNRINFSEVGGKTQWKI